MSKKIDPERLDQIIEEYLVVSMADALDLHKLTPEQEAIGELLEHIEFLDATIEKQHKGTRRQTIQTVWNPEP